MQKQNLLQTNSILSISLFCLLISIYNLSYSGTYITDDEHILASRTLSAAYDTQINDNRVLGNSRVFSYSSLSPIDASQGLNIEPFQAFLGSLFANIAVRFGIGHVQTVYLLNIYLTAITGVLIFWIILSSGYSKLTSYSIGIMFGFCTIAWPYTKTYFRDSVAMFFLTIGWGVFLLINSQNAGKPENIYRRIIYWVILLVSIIFGILSKNSVVLVVPVIILSLLIKKIRHINKFDLKNISKFNLLKWFIFVFFLFTLTILWDKLLPTTGIFSRFTLSYYQLVLRNFINNPHPQFIQALLGPLISPGKSIFLFSPILVLGLISLFLYFRKTWQAWLFLIFLIIGQGLFYGAEWWGHVNWGLRFILPAIPLLVITSAPVVEKLLATKKGMMILWISGIFSFFVQMVGLLAPVKQYYVALANTTPPITSTSAIWSPKFIAIWWHLRWIFSGGTPDLAVSRIGFISLPLIIFLLIIACSSILLFIGKYNSFYPTITLAASILSSVIMLFIFRSDPVYQPRSDLVESQKTIQENYLEDDIILIKSYGTQAWSYWMNWADPELKWISLPYYFPDQKFIKMYLFSKDPSDAPNRLSQSIIQKAEEEHTRMWIVLPSDSPGNNFNWEVTYLSQNTPLPDYWFFISDAHSTRVYLFDLNKNNRDNK